MDVRDTRQNPEIILSHLSHTQRVFFTRFSGNLVLLPPIIIIIVILLLLLLPHITQRQWRLAGRQETEMCVAGEMYVLVVLVPLLVV